MTGLRKLTVAALSIMSATTTVGCDSYELVQPSDSELDGESGPRRIADPGEFFFAELGDGASVAFSEVYPPEWSETQGESAIVTLAVGGARLDEL